MKHSAERRRREGERAWKRGWIEGCRVSARVGVEDSYTLGAYSCRVPNTFFPRAGNMYVRLQCVHRNCLHRGKSHISCVTRATETRWNAFLAWPAPPFELLPFFRVARHASPSPLSPPFSLATFSGCFLLRLSSCVAFSWTFVRCPCKYQSSHRSRDNLQFFWIIIRRASLVNL